MMDIKVVGRGGQGAVSAVYMLALSAFKEGYYTQASAVFGIERQGSEVNSYCRISKKPIYRYDEVKEPSVLILLDPTLLESSPEKVLSRNGLLLINTNKKNTDFEFRRDIIVKTINASSISLKIFNRPLFNTPMLGAFAGVTGLISISSLYKAISETFKAKGRVIIDLNKEAASIAYKEKIKDKVIVEL